jgi:hypothetical protein
MHPPLSLLLELHMTVATFFSRNEGTLDRTLRIALGLALLGVAVTGNGVWGYLGLVPLFTGLVGSCPIYSIFGFNTCPIKR